MTSDDVVSSSNPITRLAMASARNWKAVMVVWASLLLLGGFAYFSALPREGFPPINTPFALVTGPYFVGDADQVDADVAQPLAEAYLDVDGVQRVQSFASDDFVTVFVEFDQSFTSDDGVAALRALDVDLPDAADVSINPVNAASFLNRFDLLVSVVDDTADIPTEELQALADEVADTIAVLDATAEVEVIAPFTEAIDPATGQSVIRETGFSRNAVTNEWFGFDGDVTQLSAPFGDAVIIGVAKNADSGLDALGTSDAVADVLDGAVLPDGVDARISADFSPGIRTQISSLQGNLLTGLLAVAVVSFLLIGWRVATVTALFMVTVLAVAFILLWIFGVSLNTISLFALILTLGLLVDDAVVISEAIVANADEADGPVDAVRLAIDRVGYASFSGTLTTVLVFFPLLFVTGILGEFIRIMPITVIVALLVSFVLSIVLISALSGIFILAGGPNRNPLVGLQRKAAEGLGSIASLPGRNRVAGSIVGVGAVVVALGFVVAAFAVAGGLSFNIFPPAKDTNQIFVVAEFDPGTTLDQAKERSDEIDSAIVDAVGEDLVGVNYYFSSEREANVLIDLTPFQDRDPTVKDFVTGIEENLAGLEGSRVTVSQVDNGPPAEDFPWATQISSDDPAAAEAFAAALADELSGATVTRTNGETEPIVETVISTAGSVVRYDGVRIVEVRARFDAEDTTALLEATEALVTERYPAEVRGEGAVSLAFDYGQESDNAEDFANTQSLYLLALVLMSVLLVLQFRSIVKPFLVILAIPFSLFGAFTALSLSDNPISFFFMIGFTGLLGIVVNNTILLTDAANQARRAGHSRSEAIGEAVRLRFRPLVATTITTIVGLAPLAISDPFWEALSFTIMFGLLSSTVLVLIAFPFFYIAFDWFGGTIWNLITGRGEGPRSKKPAAV